MCTNVEDYNFQGGRETYFNDKYQGLLLSGWRGVVFQWYLLQQGPSSRDQDLQSLVGYEQPNVHLEWNIEVIQCIA